jgi:DNA ligase (NAD+)
VDALAVSRNKPVEDWRFLASFGIPNLGKGDSRKLLSHISLEELLDTAKVDIEKISGFGGITSKAIAQGLLQRKETIHHMLLLGFNLQRTRLPGELTGTESAIAGKGIVFTGKMQQGSREAMQDEARRLGAHVQTAVSGHTDYLVCGDKAGGAKIAKAKVLNIPILSEAQYLALIK